MKITLIGQDIPMLLPSLMADLFFSMKCPARLCVEERNPVMQAVLQRYGDAVLAHAPCKGTLEVDGDRRAMLKDADAVLYAGDLMAATRFRQDREALSGVEPEEGAAEDAEEDPGLTDQARVNGGIGGLMHTLRQGEVIYGLMDELRELCPNAIVITLGEPVARTVSMFSRGGFRCWGLGKSPLRGPGGLDGICKKLRADPKDIRAQIAGLPGFAWILSLRSEKDDDDLTDVLRDAVEAGDLGRLARRWLGWYDAVPVGDVIAHAERMAAQEDFVPEKEPAFGETVERRKERILYMNTVGDKGLAPAIPHSQPGEGVMAQMLLLSRAPAIRPMQLAVALLRGDDLIMPAVARPNALRQIAGLPRDAVIECELVLRGGEEVPETHVLPPELTEACADVAEADLLAAQAAAGDRSALRELIEQDPALGGLDRLYLQQLVDAMIRMHGDILTRFEGEEEEE